MNENEPTAGPAETPADHPATTSGPPKSAAVVKKSPPKPVAKAKTAPPPPPAKPAAKPAAPVIVPATPEPSETPAKEENDDGGDGDAINSTMRLFGWKS
ncbi:MAG: hypothetical protein SFU86_00010 [Pirellulaceae bacterium]|nr:hypothetical protein [Pirellulaceae bacterium]